MKRNTFAHGVMKKFIAVAGIVGAIFAVTGCAAGPVVNDKRAPGNPGHKTFQIQIRETSPVGPDEVWVSVPERVWDRCRLGELYRRCAG